MKIEVFTVKSCCGGKSVIFKTDLPMTTHVIEQLVKFGLKELEHFTQVGILYVHNSDFIVTGPIGSNKLQVKCKRAGCDQKLKELEVLLQKIE